LKNSDNLSDSNSTIKKVY